MAPKQYHAPRRDEFPDALSGGEGRESPGSRLGERERRNPKVENVDPAGAQPDDVVGKDRPQALAQPEQPEEDTVEEKLGLHPLGASAGAVGGTVAGAVIGTAAGPVGSLAGAVLGAFSFVLLAEWFQGLTKHWQLLMGGFIILLVAVLPQGIAGGFAALKRRFTARPKAPDAVPPSSGTIPPPTAPTPKAPDAKAPTTTPAAPTPPPAAPTAPATKK